MPTNKKPSKKIMMIIPHLDLGGAELDVALNAPIIDKDAVCDVSIFTYLKSGLLAENLVKQNVKLISYDEKIKLGFKIPLIKKILVLLRIYKTIKQHKPDIIHAFLPVSYLYSAVSCLLLGKNAPLLVMSRLNTNYHFQQSVLYRLLEPYFCHKMLHHAVVNSGKVRQDLVAEKIPPAKISLIYNGIETEKFTVQKKLLYFKQSEKYKLTATGNLNARKGYGDLLQALKILKIREKNLPFCIFVAGADQENKLPDYHQFIAQHDLAENIKFLGRCDDIPNFLTDSHLHVHPAHIEGLGSGIIEAMSAGLPIVASNVGGIPELVDDGENGILVPPHAPEKFADAIMKMINSPEKMYQYGQMGQKKAQSMFDVTRSAQQYIDLYQKL
ncbi:MAG: glycosyltransferase [Alphaproteobacteria bacterium]|nr:glycosyltransferase [Alphaproteobacteria bacterium]